MGVTTVLWVRIRVQKCFSATVVREFFHFWIIKNRHSGESDGKWREARTDNSCSNLCWFICMMEVSETRVWTFWRRSKFSFRSEIGHANWLHLKTKVEAFTQFLLNIVCEVSFLRKQCSESTWKYALGHFDTNECLNHRTRRHTKYVPVARYNWTLAHSVPMQRTSCILQFVPLD